MHVSTTQLISSISSAIISVLSMISALFAFIQARHITKQVQEVHLSINSRLDQMLELTRSDATSKAHAEGMAEGLIAGQKSSDKVAASHAAGILEGIAQLSSPTASASEKSES